MLRRVPIRLITGGLVAIGTIPVAVLLSPSTAFAADDITTACTGTTVGTTFTLTADCDTSVPLTVPDGFTLDGGSPIHVITAHDPVGGGLWPGGAVVSNAGTSMTVNNLIIRGTTNGFATICAGTYQLLGLFFNDADGSATNVTVADITQHSGCQTGTGIRANALAATARTVTLTGVTVTGFQKNGVTGSGKVTLNISGSTIGPPDAHAAGAIATNSVQYGVGGAGGMFTDNTVNGSGFGADTNVSTAILLYGASNLTIDRNTITGTADVGISVNASSNVTISNNQIGRTDSVPPDAAGIGADVDTVTARTSPLDPSEGTLAASTNVALICNTFDNWTTDISGAQQPPCNADLALTKVVSNAAPNVGDQVTFTVTLTNIGPDTATNVQVTDLVPAGLTFVSATPSQGTYASATGLWAVGTVTTAAPQTLQLLVTIASTAGQTNTAAISASDQPDPNTANNTASVTVTPVTPTTTTSTTTTTIAPTTTIAGSGGQLPPTGPSSDAPLYIAVVVLALGAVLIAIARRRAAHG